MIDLNNVNAYKLILNKQCNYNCVYCLQGTKYDIIKQEELSPKEMASYFPPNKRYHIVYFGGEPLLNFDYLIEFTDCIYKKNDQAIFSVITNGSLLTNEMVDKLNERNIRVTISHDAVAQKITRNNVDVLEEKGDIISRIKTLGFISTLTKYNWNYFENWNFFENFRKKYNLKQSTINHMNVRDLLNNIPEDLFIYESKEYEDMLDKVYEELKKDIINDNRESYVYRAFWKTISRMYYENCLGDGITPCYSNNSVVNVDTHGNIYACHNSNIINGNIRNLADVKVNNLKMRKECETCIIRDYCPKCPRVVPQKVKYYCYHYIQNYTRLFKMLEEISQEKFNKKLILNDRSE